MTEAMLRRRYDASSGIVPIEASLWVSPPAQQALGASLIVQLMLAAVDRRKPLSDA
jgi:hypothetical protein